jgi:hypothetical protein
MHLRICKLPLAHSLLNTPRSSTNTRRTKDILIQAIHQSASSTLPIPTYLQLLPLSLFGYRKVCSPGQKIAQQANVNTVSAPLAIAAGALALIQRYYVSCKFLLFQDPLQLTYSFTAIPNDTGFTQINQGDDEGYVEYYAKQQRAVSSYFNFTIDHTIDTYPGPDFAIPTLWGPGYWIDLNFDSLVASLQENTIPYLTTRTMNEIFKVSSIFI